MTLRVLIVDDEPPARARLGRLLRAQPDVTSVGEAATGIEALAAIETLAPDLVLLDVQMPELDGLGVASVLGAGGPAVVFVTAHEQHALRAFELAAVDYLLKPIAKERLRTALDRVIARQERVPAGEQARAVRAGLPADANQPRPRKMAVREGAKYVVFDLACVTAVLASDHYAQILVDGRELLADESLDSIMARLDPSRFVRVHRSAIVNLERVQELAFEGERKYVALLSDPAKTRVPIARDRLDEVKSRLGVP